jgi:hypothetical protein
MEDAAVQWVLLRIQAGMASLAARHDLPPQWRYVGVVTRGRQLGMFLATFPAEQLI